MWFTQGIFLYFALSYLITAVPAVAMLIRRGDTPSLVIAIRLIVICLGIELLLLVPFWGLAKGKMYGRWLGVLSLIVIWGCVTYIQIHQPSTSILYKNTWGVVTQILVNLALLVLIIRLASARRTSQFFRREIEVT